MTTTVPPAPSVYVFGAFRFEVGERRFSKAGEPIHLAPKAFDLLAALLSRPNQVISRGDLLELVWPGTFVEDGAVAVHVSGLRKILGPDSGVAIETVPKVGYRLLGDIRRLADGGRASGPVAVAALSPDVSPPLSIAPALPPAAASRRPWSVVAGVLAVAVVAGVVLWQRQATPARITSLAVLPFTTIVSGDDTQGHLTIGMADAIITRLASLGSLRLPPTATIRHFVGSTRLPADIGRELGVQAILTGSLARADDRIRVNLQLTRVSDGARIWSGRFDERFTGIFSVQDAITEQVASSLLLDLTGRAGPRRATTDTEAYEIYLRAREQWARRTAASIKTAIQMYQQAIDRDPAFALAHAGIADAYSLTASAIPPAERFPRAKAAAVRAMELDDSLAEAHNALAFMSYKFEWKWDVAEREFRRALELDPSYVLAHHWYGEFQSIVGRHDAAIAALKRARELDPYSVAIINDHGAALVRARRPADAIAVFHEGIDKDPSSAALYNSLSNALRMAGRHDEAFEALVRVRVLGGAGEDAVRALRDAYAKGGWDALTRAELARLLEAEKKADPRIINVSSIAGLIARQYATLRDDENALAWMEEAARRRDDGPLTIRSAWYWEPYRNHPRIKAIEQRLGIPQP